MADLYTDLGTPIALLGSDPKKDKFVGFDELGNAIYQNISGAKYVVGSAKPSKSLPETARDTYEAIPPMEEWTAGGAAKAAGKLATGAVKGVVQGAIDTIKTPTNPNATLGDTLGVATSMPVAGALSAGKGALKASQDTTQMFVGPKSKVTGSRLQHAKDLEEVAGYPPETVEWATPGVYKDPHTGNYMGEISDKGVKIDLSKMNEDGVGLLSDLMDHKTLYEEYPDLAFLRVEAIEKSDLKKYGLTEGTLAGYYPDEGVIRFPKDKPIRISTLLHEVQHRIQDMEGMPSGANPKPLGKLKQQFSTSLPEVARDYLNALSHIKYADADSWAYEKESVDGWKKMVRQFEEKYPDVSQSLKDAEFLLDETGESLYRQEPGEVLARLTQKRKDLGDLERLHIDPFKEAPLLEFLSDSTYKTGKTKERISNTVKAAQFFIDEDLPKEYAEGGLVTDNLEEALPPGATPKDVADDITAKVSEGEFIIPANVVRYVGVSKLEKLVQKALEELQGMEAGGRMGKEPMMEEEDEEEDELEFASGGLVPEQPTPELTQAGFTGFEVYTNENGQRMSIPTKNGVPVITPPAGYTKSTGQAKPTGPVGVEDPNGKMSGNSVELTGASKSLKDWTADDYMQMAQTTSTSAGRVGNKAVGAMMNAVPLGGLVKKATDNKLSVAKKQLADMLKSGVGLDGKPISPDDLEKLKQAQSMIENPQVAGTDEKLAGGLMKGISGGKGVFGTAVEAAKATVDNPLTKAVKGLEGAINDAIRGAIDTTFGEKKAASTETTTDQQSSTDTEAKGTEDEEDTVTQ